MRRLPWLLSAFSAALLVAGCGPAMLKTKGRLVKEGAPYRPADGEMIRVMFVPIPPGGEVVKDYFMAQYNPKDGSFQVVGKDGKGMPPGKYRIAVEHLRQKNDLLNGVYNSEDSPFVREVTPSTGELVLDFSKPQG